MTEAADHSYFQNTRSEIEPLLGPEPKRILEIGCGAGSTLAWLKKRWPAAETVGVDGYAPIEPELAARVDRAIIHDLDQPLPDLGQFDLILALDVLEHLRDPWATTNRLAEMLTRSGMLVLSVPNVAHYRVLWPLIARGEFRYTDSGALDRTHLRFFARNSATELLTGAGLKVTGGLATGFGGLRQRLAHRLSLGLLKPMLTYQYILRGERNGQEKAGLKAVP